MGINEFVVQKLGMPVAEKLKGWPVTKYWKELEESQWWTPEQLREMQNEKLRVMVRHAYETVQYYRELFDAHNLRPDDIKTIADLPKIPLLSKDTIKANYPDKLASNRFDDKSVIECKSSGSTGAPVKFQTSLEEKGFMWGLLFRMWGWTGWEPGMKYVNFTICEEVAMKKYPILRDIETYLTRVITLDPRFMDDPSIAKFIKEVISGNPYMLRGHPSTCYYLARYMSEHDIRFNLKACICMGETLFPFIREAVEERFGCGIYDNYGCEGVSALAQCSPTSKMHISSETVITEIVDDDGNPVPSGVEGRLVMTSLGKYAMPLLRYDTQDVASMTDELCSCCRGLPLINSLKGRMVDISYTPSGKLIAVYMFTPLLGALSDEIDGWQVVHEAPSELVINVVPRGSLRQESVKHIISTTQGYLGDDIEVRVQEVESIPLTPSGKRRFFISKCAKGTQPRDMR
ncbi:MAG: phenylacetate--CoA ligase family protein [Armatimonadota bacterium]